MIKDGDIITYRKNPKRVDLSCFEKKKTVINGKEFDYAPYVHEVTLCVYGSQILFQDIDHSSPDYKRIGKNLKKIKQKIAVILSRDLVGLADEDLAHAIEQFQKVHKSKAGKKLQHLCIGQIQSEVKETPKRITSLNYNSY